MPVQGQKTHRQKDEVWGRGYEMLRQLYGTVRYGLGQAGSTRISRKNMLPAKTCERRKRP
jgi:hypothetical protein